VEVTVVFQLQLCDLEVGVEVEVEVGLAQYAPLGQQSPRLEPVMNACGHLHADHVERQIHSWSRKDRNIGQEFPG
jgi:hypothetical protein